MNIKKAVVILPCLNEERTVGEVIKKLKKVSESLNIKIIILGVDDHSDDLTYEILKNNSNKSIRFKKRVSLSKVVKKGIEESLKYNSDIIIHIDSDGQYDPLQLPKLIKEMERKKLDMIIGVRDIKNLKHMSKMKKIGNQVFSKLVSILINQKLKDTQSGFRIIKSEILKDIKIISTYTYTQEEIMRAKKLGAKIGEVSIKFSKRKHGKSRLIRHEFIYGVRAFIDIIKVMINTI